MKTQVKEYQDLSPAEQDQLSKAWAKIAEGLNVYEQVTGAYQLDDILYDVLWETIGYQKEDRQ